jgi:uncharacterized protein YggE
MSVRIAAALAALSLAAASAAAEAPVRRVTVIGEGAAEAAPDMARAAFGVVVRAATAGDAYAEADRLAAAIRQAVLSAGVAAADLQTTSLRLNPVWTHERDSGPRLEGYEALRLYAAVVRDLTVLGPVLDAAAQAGATLFEGVHFDVGDRGPLEDAARRAAIADARRAAALLAEGAGATVGEALEVTLIGGAGPAPMLMRAAMDEAAAVSPGTLSVVAQVQASFALAD